jgi:hypothetical protein
MYLWKLLVGWTLSTMQFELFEMYFIREMHLMHLTLRYDGWIMRFDRPQD